MHLLRSRARCSSPLEKLSELKLHSARTIRDFDLLGRPGSPSFKLPVVRYPFLQRVPSPGIMLMMQITAFSAEFLQVPLCYQTLNISLANVELRVFREIYGTAPSNQMEDLAHVGFTKTYPYSV
jgi:hypothetical protein